MTDAKKYALIAVILVPIIVVVSFFVTRVDEHTDTSGVKEEAIALLDDPIDFSQTLYPPEDRPLVEELINRQRTELEQEPIVKWETLTNIASLYKDVRDYSHALQFYNLLDRIKPEDLSYRLERGQLYLQMGNPEASVSEIQPLEKDWPVPETFIYLADAYKKLDGTPDYVIDEIYEEGIDRHRGQFDIVAEYVRWLEKTGREEKTIDYYQIMYDQTKDPELLQKIDDLKTKYAA